MQQVDENTIRQMVEKVVSNLERGWGNRPSPTPGQGVAPPVGALQRTWQSGKTSSGSFPTGQWSSPVLGRYGQFNDVNEAVAAAVAAQASLMRRSLAQRKKICEAIITVLSERKDELGRLEYEETKIGYPPHKPIKLQAVVDLALHVDYIGTTCFSGDHGITVEEHAPWGVIGIVTPVTHSLPTLANNAINIIAAGNSLVCNPHPAGKKIAAYGARLFNEAIYAESGIDNLISVITEPTLESANQIFTHREIGLLGITGGPGVVAAALNSGKRAICAGPGNPPAVVDASADIENAAACVIEGGGFDYNLLCLSEKEVFVEAPAFDAFMEAMSKQGAYCLSSSQMDQLASICIFKNEKGHYVAQRKFVGASPQVIARKIGLQVSSECPLLFGPTGSDHPFVQAEQMMPVMPVVRCESFEDAVEFARQAEHGFGHTAVIHSRLVDHMTHMGKMMDTALFVKNGPSLAGDGMGGEGYGGYSIACATGEGIATPLTYTRLRRCTMVDNLRIL